jgi:sugar-specific transcriptional regulator TrmB
VPLLFKAVAPRAVFEKVKGDLERFLESLQATLKEEVNNMCEKFDKKVRHRFRAA